MKVLAHSGHLRKNRGMTLLGGEFPTFFFHLMVGPMLKLLEQGRFDHGKADADAAFLADPRDGL